MRAALLKSLYVAVEEWAHEHNVEPTFIEVRYDGLGDNVEVLLVARNGLENWNDIELHHSFFDFIRDRFDQNDGLGLVRFYSFTEDEYERRGGQFACNHLASMWYGKRWLPSPLFTDSPGNEDPD